MSTRARSWLAENKATPPRTQWGERRLQVAKTHPFLAAVHPECCLLLAAQQAVLCNLDGHVAVFILLAGSQARADAQRSVADVANGDTIAWEDDCACLHVGQGVVPRREPADCAGSLRSWLTTIEADPFSLLWYGGERGMGGVREAARARHQSRWNKW